MFNLGHLYFSSKYSYFQHAHGWYPTFWGRFYRTIFHIHRNMGKSILLSFWIFIPGICDTGDILFTNINCDGLLPTVWRGTVTPWEKIKNCIFFFISGLSLVVEKFYSFWRFGFLHFRLFSILFRDKVGNYGIHTNTAVHLLHWSHGVYILVTYRHHRILRCLRIRWKNLCGSKNRLKCSKEIERCTKIKVNEFSFIFSHWFLLYTLWL